MNYRRYGSKILVLPNPFKPNGQATGTQFRHLFLNSTNYATDIILLGEISGADGGEYEDDSLLRFAPCSLVQDDQYFGGTYYLHHQGDESSPIVLMMEAISTSETTVNFYETTRRNIPKDCTLHHLGVIGRISLPSVQYKLLYLKVSGGMKRANQKERALTF
jgi:hypothetical protein